MIHSIPPEPELTVSPKRYQAMVSSYLRRIDFKIPEHDLDYNLEAPIFEYIEAQPWPADVKARCMKLAAYLATGMGYMHPKVSLQDRVYHTIYGALTVFYDDELERERATNPNEVGELGDFTAGLICGQKQSNPVLESLAQYLRFILPTWRGPYAASTITRATIDFVEASQLEARVPTQPRGAVSFPWYLRFKTGIAEPWALQTFPEDVFPEAEYLDLYLPAIPALCNFINQGNDIMSFYKEAIVGGERHNYVCSVALAQGCSAEEALAMAIESVVSSVEEVREVLAPYPELLEYANSFIGGFMGWHFNESKRYRLDELEITDAEGRLVHSRRK